MKKYRQLLMGIIIGALTMLTVGVMANSVGTVKVSAWLTDNVKFTFDGEFRDVPEEYGVLIYNDRTYVPTRFVANNLGAEVAWDDTSRTAIITSKPCPKCEEVVEEDNKVTEPKEEDSKEAEDKQAEQEEKKEEGQPKGDYRKLPLTKYYDDMEITATLVNLTNEYNTDTGANHTRLHLRVENKEDTPLQLQQTKTKAIVDGKEYKTAKEPAYRLDTKWYNDIYEDEVVEGYIALPLLPEDAKEMKVTLYILENDWKQTEREVEFDIALNLK